MAVSGVLGWLNIRGVNAHLELPDEVYCGLATLATVRLTNSKRLFPSFLLRVTVLESSFTAELLGRGSSTTTSFVQTFSERGRTTIPFAEIRSPFPINFFVRRRRTPLDQQFLVFPGPLPCSAVSATDKAQKTGALPAARKGFEGDVSRIADYTGREPMKLIHWRLSAKHEEFKVKEMQAASGEPVIIDLDALPGKNLEENLSCATFLINRLIAASRPVGLRLRERVIPPALSREHRLGLLAELALYGRK